MTGSIVYNLSIVYKHQNFLKVVVRVIIIDRASYEIQITAVYSHTLFLSLWRQSAVASGLSLKPSLGHLGHWKTVPNQIRSRRTRHLIRVCTVCLNYRKLRVEFNNHLSHRWGPFPSLHWDIRPTGVVSVLMFKASYNTIVFVNNSPESDCSSCLYVINFRDYITQSTLFIPTLDKTTKFVIMTIWMSRNLCSRGDS